MVYQGLTLLLKDGPNITEVSTTLGSFTQPTGSLLGGTQIYIKGTNFEADATKNAIWVGPYPCEILADGASETNLACRTTAATDPNKTWNLPVKVEVDQRGAVECASANCRYQYRDDRTPMIHEIYPRSAVGNEKLYVFGRHRISDLGDERSNGAGEIEYFLVGDKVCSLLDVDQEF